MTQGKGFNSAYSIQFNNLEQNLSRATLSTTSTQSNTIQCRICQDNRLQEILISPCYCTGTMGNVHSSCLERWLSQTARNDCELCSFKFKTKMTVKSFRDWLMGEDFALMERRYMLTDLACFLILTPLGLVSSWLCIKGAQEYYFKADFWSGFGLILMTGFLGMLYLFWMIITLRYHFVTFKRWQRRNTEVRLIFSNHCLNKLELAEKTSRSNASETDEILVYESKMKDAGEENLTIQKRDSINNVGKSKHCKCTSV